MAYILSKNRQNETLDDWKACWAAYTGYLETIKDRLPSPTYEFAAAPWYHDFGNHMSPHDGWLEMLFVSEHSYGERAEHSSTKIVLRLLAAYHDGYIEFSYEEVQRYSVSSLRSEQSNRTDWLYDEVRLSEQGYVLHEIEWSEGSNWTIEAKNITYKWIPVDEHKDGNSTT